MATIIQRLKAGSHRKKDNARTHALRVCPHARGWVNRVTIVTPRKPNSAKRPVIKVFLKRRNLVRRNRLTAHIPGIGHTLKKFSKILLRGRGPRDLPGVRYSGVRGVLDFIGLKKKKRRRSIYGAAQNDISKIRARRKYRVAIRTAENERINKIAEEATLLQEPNVTVAIISILKLKKQNTVHQSYTQYNNIFFKKPLGYTRFSAVPTEQETCYMYYSAYLFTCFFYDIVNIKYIYFFLNNIILCNNIYNTTILFLKKSIFQKKKKINIIDLSFFNFSNFNLYFNIIFKKPYKFIYTIYYMNKKDFYLPPKKRINNILKKQKLYNYLISKKNSNFYTKRLVQIFKKHSIASNYFQDFDNDFNFFAISNKNLFNSKLELVAKQYFLKKKINKSVVKPFKFSRADFKKLRAFNFFFKKKLKNL